MKNIAVKLNFRGEQSVLHGHPWVFENQITKINQTAETGDVCIIFSKSKNKMIGIGLYDASSTIRIKLIYHGQDNTSIHTDFFYQKIQSAYSKRLPLLDTNTNSYRLIFGENDGFPGLIADVYAKVLVVKLYSEIWLPYIDSILQSLQHMSQTDTTVIRLSRQLQQSKSLKFTDGQVVSGVLENDVIEFWEHGVRFSANVIKGHKTGYFLDHRHNRKRVGALSKNKTVLDVFAYAGGFSIHALAGGAVEVTSVDISQKALDIAKQNALLNKYKGLHRTITGDAFEILKQLINKGKTFDIVVIDPPSFAKQQSQIKLAKKKYAELAHLGAQLTNRGGVLVLASCSSRVSAQAFFDLNAQTLSSKGFSFNIIEKTTHDIDHPISFLEGAYLKCGFYRF